MRVLHYKTERAFFTLNGFSGAFRNRSTEPLSFRCAGICFSGQQ